MKQVTLDHHPDFAAVIDGRGDLDAALREARTQIILPQNQCVVVVRGSASLSETHRRVAAGLKAENTTNRTFARANDSQFVWRDSCGQFLNWVDKTGLEAQVGPDLGQFLSGISSAFNGLRQMEVRAEDYNNAMPHLDFAVKRLAGLAGGITATMAVAGGGTVIAGLTRDMLKYEWNDDAAAMAWRLIPGATMDEQHSWAVADGDICLLRAQDWPETHLPGLHRSPERRYPTDARERVVGVMLT